MRQGSEDLLEMPTPEAVSVVSTIRKRRKSIILFSGGVLLLMATSGGWFLSFPEWSVGQKAAPALHDPMTDTEPDERIRPGEERITANPETAAADTIRPEQILGRWVRDGSIQRDIVFLPEGKATLTVRLDYFSALIYGREMHMDLIWKLEDGILTNTVVGGTPKANVARLIRDFGDSLSYRVVQADQKELILKDLGNSDEGLTHWIAVK